MKIHVTDRTNRTKQLIARMLLEAADHQPSTIWLVTPWLKNVEFDATDLGPYHSLFGAHRHSVTLLDILGLLSSKHLLQVVVKPPHELVPIPLLERIVTLHTERAALLAQEIDFDVERTLLNVIDENLSEARRSFINHADTLMMAEQLAQRGAQVAFRDALHAKVLWLPSGALFGSANFTNGGLSYNAEVIAEVLDDAGMDALLGACERIREESWSRDAYDLANRAQVKARHTLNSETFFACANDPHVANDPSFRPLLEYLGGLYR